MLLVMSLRFFALARLCAATVYSICFFIFFFNETSTTEIYTLSLHDALPISDREPARRRRAASFVEGVGRDSRSVGLGDHCGVACRRPTSPERRPALGPA